MQITDNAKVVIPSKLADLRDVPLAAMPALSTATRAALGRVTPEQQQVVSAPVAFQSAI
jgi:FXSXX-COOH protein